MSRCGEKPPTNEAYSRGGIVMEGNRGRGNGVSPCKRPEAPRVLWKVGLQTWLEGVGNPKFTRREGQ